MKIVVSFLFMVFFFVSCQTLNFTAKTKMLPIDYVGWVENDANGLKVSVHDGIYMYELQYQPIEYLILQEVRSTQISSKELKAACQKRDGLLYFTLKMQTEEGKGILSDKDLDFEHKSSYLLSGLQNDMLLVAGLDSLHCVMCHLETANNLVPYDQCVLAFEKPKSKNENLVFIFKTDKYKEGFLKIIVEREDIKKTPKLKTL